jgi:hypothetical protein
MQQDILPLISESLDHKSLALLLATSKENAALLGPLFTAKARPHLLRHMAQQIIDACMHAPSDVYSARAIEDDGLSIRFTTPRHDFGPMALFSVAVSDPIRVTVKVGYNVVYNNSVSSYSFITNITTVHISLSARAFRIERGTASTDYVGAFSPERVLEWCPVGILVERAM